MLPCMAVNELVHYVLCHITTKISYRSQRQLHCWELSLPSTSLEKVSAPYGHAMPHQHKDACSTRYWILRWSVIYLSDRTIMYISATNQTSFHAISLPYSRDISFLILSTISFWAVYAMTTAFTRRSITQPISTPTLHLSCHNLQQLPSPYSLPRTCSPSTFFSTTTFSTFQQGCNDTGSERRNPHNITHNRHTIPTHRRTFQIRETPCQLVVKVHIPSKRSAVISVWGSNIHTLSNVIPSSNSSQWSTAKVTKELCRRHH